MDEIKKSWCKHEFTEEELKILYSGGEIRLDDCITLHGNRFGCFVTLGEMGGRRQIIPRFTE